MTEQTTDDGITVSEIDATYKVLETLRENLSDDGMNNLSEIVNEAHYLVQQYDEGANWGNDYYMPALGEIMLDPESNPKYGNGRVEITEVLSAPASEVEIERRGRTRTIAEENSHHPADAPVVRGRYVEGSDKVYAFPVTRLEITGE